VVTVLAVKAWHPASPLVLATAGDEKRWRAETFDFDTVDHVRVEVDEVIEAADGETVVMAVRTLGPRNDSKWTTRCRGRPW